MKKHHKSVWRSVIALVLTVTLVLGTASTAFAQSGTNAAGGSTLNYVAIGASQTNGYGLQGYLPITVENGVVPEDQLPLLQGLVSGKISKDDINVYGYQRAPEGAYPDLIRDAFESKGYDVNLDQLAISSMRAEEGRMLLDDGYYGDSYTAWRFYDENGDGWFSSAAKQEGMTNAEALAALRQEYQTAVKNADVITYDLGVNNFGVYTINRIDSGIDNPDNPKYDADFSKLLEGEDYEKFMEMRTAVEKMLTKYVGESDPESAKFIQLLTDTFAYALIGYCVNFDKSMEIIYELNPDATVVVVSIQNLMKGMTAKIPGVKDEIPLGEIYGVLVEMANQYASKFSPYAERNCYAKAGNVSLFLEDILAYDGNPDSLDQDMKDCFGLYDNSLFGWELFVRYFEYAELNQTHPEVVNAGVNAAYDVLAKITQRCAQEHVFDFGALDKMDSSEDILSDYIEGALYGSLEAGMTGKTYDLDLSVLDNPDLATAMSIAVRFEIGNSFFAHPNREGHAERAAMILDVLEKAGDDSVDSDAASLKAEIAKVQAKINELNAQIKELTEKDATVAELDALKAELEKAEALLAEGLEGLALSGMEVKKVTQSMKNGNYTVKWTAGPKVKEYSDLYRVKVYRNGKLWTTKFVDAAKASITFKAATKGCKYYAYVAPVKVFNEAKYAGIAKKSGVLFATIGAPTFKAPKSNNGKNVTLKATDKNTTGYQVMVSKNKNFKTYVKKVKYITNGKALNKVVKTNKFFVKGTNYVKVRAYTTINGKTFYGKWSNAKVIKR